MHLATPERALMLARALGVLPPRVLMVGCQPVDAEEVGEGMSPPVTAAVELAVRVIHEQVAKFLAPEPGPVVAAIESPAAVGAAVEPAVAQER
jgi:hydrogenase maturation protease